MTRDEFLARLDRVRQWRRGNQRAPHKPLLLLLALGRVSRGQPRLTAYADVHDALRRLLADYGPPRRVHHPNMPFWRLQKDGIWEIPEADRVSPRAGGDVSPKALLDVGAHGGFPARIHDLLAADPGLMEESAARLLDSHFPESLHDPIRDAVGLDLLPLAAEEPAPYADRRRRRDPSFRRAVITAYERRCAICDFDIRLDDSLLGIEAAHIRWVAYDGPDEVRNGLALCVLHHRALDRGAIGLAPDPGRSGAPDYRLIVSRELSGSSAAFHQLVDFRGRRLHRPQSGADAPRPEFVDWHRREVFRGEPRAAL